MRLKAFRKSLNISQNEMSKLLGVSKSYYSKVESGYQKPSFEFLCKFKSVFKKESIDKIFFSKQNKN